MGDCHCWLQFWRCAQSVGGKSTCSGGLQENQVVHVEHWTCVCQPQVPAILVRPGGTAGRGKGSCTTLLSADMTGKGLHLQGRSEVEWVLTSQPALGGFVFTPRASYPSLNTVSNGASPAMQTCLLCSNWLGAVPGMTARALWSLAPASRLLLIPHVASVKSPRDIDASACWECSCAAARPLARTPQVFTVPTMSRQHRLHTES